ncbi:hypothetical protein TYRP_018972 [Tyrophagus putrescentiae]|nr:hypothetical protein TYRP_018972 [Tyrophagus putrescentiae]
MRFSIKDPDWANVCAHSSWRKTERGLLASLGSSVQCVLLVNIFIRTSSSSLLLCWSLLTCSSPRHHLGRLQSKKTEEAGMQWPKRREATSLLPL